MAKLVTIAGSAAVCLTNVKRVRGVFRGHRGQKGYFGAIKDVNIIPILKVVNTIPLNIDPFLRALTADISIWCVSFAPLLLLSHHFRFLILKACLDLGPHLRVLIALQI